jgi:hypothetical protein
MTRNDLVDQLSRTRAEMEQAIAGLNDAQLTQPGPAGEWSIKDILLHLSLWEAEMVKTLYQAAHEQKPTTEIFNPEYLKVNDCWYAENKDRPLNFVLQDFRAVRPQLLRRLADLNDDQLLKPGYYAWMDKNTLAGLVEDICVGHEQEHIEQILAWRKAITG